MRSSDLTRADDVGLDLGQILRALWEARLRVLAFTAAAAIIVFVVLNLVTPRFTTEAKILIESRDLSATGAPQRGQEVERAVLDQEGVASQVQLLTSRDLARQVIQKLDLASRPEYGGGGLLRGLLKSIGLGSKTETPIDERALERFKDDVLVYQQEKSRVIVITATAVDPDLAARIANTLAEEYIAFQAGTKRDEARDQLRWLEGEIGTLRTRVEEADAKVERYRAGAELFLGPGNATLTTQQLGELNSQLTSVRAQRADAEAKARQLRSLLTAGAALDGASEILGSPTFQRLKDRRAAIQGRIAELSATLLPNHPQIRTLNAQVGDIDSQLRAEARKILSALENDVKVAEARVRDINAQLDRVKQESVKASEQDIQLRALEREAKTQRDLLESMLARYRETAARQNAETLPADARIISRATPPIQASFPKVLSSTIVAALGAFLLAATVVVLRELLSGRALRHGTTGPAAAAFAPPVFRPPVDREGGDDAEPLVTPVPAAPASPLAGFSGTIADFVTAVAEAPSAPAMIIVVPVAAAGAGSALTLARLLARETSRVALIELAPFDELRKPPAAGTTPAAGLFELQTGSAAFGDVIVRDDLVPRLHRVGPGNGKPLESEDGDERLASFMEAFAHAYDTVILAFSDVADMERAPATVLAADAIVLAATPADRRAADEARQALAAAGLPTIATVVATPEARPRLAPVAAELRPTA